MTTTAGNAADMDDENAAPDTNVVAIGDVNKNGQRMDEDEAPSFPALSLFKSQINGDASTNSRLMSQRQAYEDRLRTFHAVNYMFKPNCLSPVICARFGYVKSVLNP